MQVAYLTNKADVPYGAELFQGLAQDIFHLVPPPEGIAKVADLPAASALIARPSWYDRLKDDADPAAFHSDAVSYISK